MKCSVSKTVVCRQCGKPGHLQKACRSLSPREESKPVLRVDEEEQEPEAATLWQVRSSKSTASSSPIIVKMQIDDCLIEMEVDTGASMTLLSECTLIFMGRGLGGV